MDGLRMDCGGRVRAKRVDCKCFIRGGRRVPKKNGAYVGEA
jgi:hypothetical protein